MPGGTTAAYRARMKWPASLPHTTVAPPSHLGLVGDRYGRKLLLLPGAALSTGSAATPRNTYWLRPDIRRL